LITAGIILQHVRKGRVLSAIPIRDSEAEVLELEAMEHTRGVGKPLYKIWKRFVGGSIVGAITRNSKLIIPDGNSVIQPGDNVIVFALPEAIGDVESLFVKT
jgi:trk system potassium uptake protein TrkA